MISESSLERIKTLTPIVDVISEYTTLKKSGRGFSGLCPFHQEKTPSFHVQPEKQIFHCFGCHKGGNVFTFYSLIEGLSFPEAVKKLAAKAGVELEETETRRKPEFQKQAHPRAEKIKEALQWAAQYYQYLLQQGKEWAWVRDYVKKRNLSEKTVQKFQIGVSPGGWGTLRDLMLKRNFTIDDLLEAGLLVLNEKEKSKSYDRFRERLMFPIRNESGEVIGFGARILKNEEDKKQPKYVNSPESPVFSKKNTLYGLYENARHIRLKGELIVVEGYMDVCGLHDKGVDNAVASMGTALTEEHVYLIKKMTNQVVTVFDPDESGRDASKRSTALFLKAGVFAKEILLPDEQDPDEYVSQHGSEKFYELCQRAPRQITQRLKEIATLGALTEEQRETHLKELLPILLSTRRSSEQMLVWDNIALVLQVSLPSLQQMVEREFNRTPAPPTLSPPPSFQNKKSAAKVPLKKLDILDVSFFKEAIQHPQIFKDLEAEAYEAGIFDQKLKTFLQEWRKAVLEGQENQKLISWIAKETDAHFQSLFSELLLTEGQPASKEGPKIIQVLFEQLKKRGVEKEIKSINTQLKLTEKMGKQDEAITLLARLKELRNEINTGK